MMHLKTELAWSVTEFVSATFAEMRFSIFGMRQVRVLSGTSMCVKREPLSGGNLPRSSLT